MPGPRLTISIFAQESIGVLECSSLPPVQGEIIAEEFEHHILFLVTWCLTPQAVYDLFLAERKEDQRAGCRVTVFLSHEGIARHYFQLAFLRS
jgi:hypothetical protein